jgi:hypothetical protein
MNQGISLNREKPFSEIYEFIDFGRERWPENMDAWLDRRYRVMPLDGYNTQHPRIDRFPDNINVKDPVFQRS